MTRSLRMVSAWLDGKSPPSASTWGWRCFQLGLFFLPSSALLAGLLLFPALILGSVNRERPFWRDPWNAPLLLAGLFMVVGCVRSYSGPLAWVGLGNWIPFFWGFWGFQPYVALPSSRRRSSLWLVAGSVPVVVTGLGQLWFGWQGPWQIFGGLIIWFMSAGGRPEGRLSGLFDYANIASAWLAMVWPLMLATLVQPGLNRVRRGVVLTMAASVVLSLVLTESRNGWGALVLAVPLVLGPPSWPWLLPLLGLALVPVLAAVLPGVPPPLQDPARMVVPEGIWARLSDTQYASQRALASTRLSQWGLALQLIAERPWFGWGAAAFSVIYPLRTGKWHGHAHNLPLELAISHGLPAAVLVVALVLLLLVVSLRRGSLGLFDRAWWTAALVLTVLHATDLPFFDSRLNIAGWILLAGLRTSFSPSPQPVQGAVPGADA
ncbi:O-antigen ligase family protein [Synechococcus sp. PROS-7-1]|uniref:O-antigen ligase family protein n=1 Tax=Synechococcus sp. PROS-7-1 TaxID=1442556 RepID=UPI0016496B11|nr:O-antigen ligase family protein [Synechococcus sp. PROS-7-1]QNI86646.1 O-antigen ligase family protein [Synechococcus sp. PROS-7-1]